MLSALAGVEGGGRRKEEEEEELCPAQIAAFQYEARAS